LEQALEDAIAANNLLAITALATELASFPERKTGFVLQALTLGYREAVLTLLDLLGTPSELDHVHKKSAAISKVCEIGDEELFDILVEKGADINISPGENALTMASQNCHLSIARKLLDNKVYNRYFSYASYKRKGALAMASTYGHAEIVSLLLEKDSNHFVKKVPKDFNRALNAAIKEKRVSCAKLLLNWALEKDSSILPTKLRKNLGESIDHMIETLSAEQAKIIGEDGGTKGNTLQAKARKGDCEAVSLLLDLGADIDNLQGEYGTPMMAAASNGKLEMIHLLIERGADVKKKDDRKDGSGGSAIDEAAANCHETVVRALLDKGAVFTHESTPTIYNSRYTPLQALSRGPTQQL
jgi:ankyrin repeat protein